MLKIENKETKFGEIADQMTAYVKELLTTTSAAKKQSLTKFREFVGDAITTKFGYSIIRYHNSTIFVTFQVSARSLEFKMKFKNTGKTARISAIKSVYLYEFLGIESVNPSTKSVYSNYTGFASLDSATEHAYDSWSDLYFLNSQKYNGDYQSFAIFLHDLFNFPYTGYYSETKHNFYDRTEPVFKSTHPWVNSDCSFVSDFLYYEFGNYQTGSLILNHSSFTELFRGILADVKDKGHNFNDLSKKLIEHFNIKHKFTKQWD